MPALFFSRSGIHLILLSLIWWIAGCARSIQLPGDSTDFSGGSLSLIHFNDGASRILNAGVTMEDYGGVARFATVVANLKKKSSASETPSHTLITISAGNDFQPGQIFNVSIRNGVPFFDSTALDLIGVDTILLAGHAFDMGPDILAQYIAGFNRTHPVFLSANLDFSREPSLRSLSDDRVIRPSTIIERGGFKFGLIGITSPSIAKHSSPRRLLIDDDLPAIIHKQVNTLLKMNVDRVILIANFNSLENARRLIRKTSGIDIVIAGSIDKKKHHLRYYLSESYKHLPPYPIFIQDSTGRNVVLAGTPGDFCFVGHIKVYFDSNGEIAALAPNSGISKVVGDGMPNAVPPDKEINRAIVIPLAKALSTTSRSIATSQVLLDGDPSHVATRETNFGDLAADAVLWRSTILSKHYDTALPTLSLLKSSLFKSQLLKGAISDADIFTSISSRDSLAIIEGVSPTGLKLLIENMLRRYGSKDAAVSSFPQISGMSLVFNPTRPPGSRVKSIRLNTGDAVVLNYKVLPYAPKVNIATVGSLPTEKNILSSNSTKRINIGELPQNAVTAYLSASVKNKGLNGCVSSKTYPPTGLGRIMITRE